MAFLISLIIGLDMSWYFGSLRRVLCATTNSVCVYICALMAKLSSQKLIKLYINELIRAWIAHAAVQLFFIHAIRVM